MFSDDASYCQIIVQNAGSVIWLFDINEDKFVFITPGVEILRGYSSSEVKKFSFKEILTSHSFNKFNHSISQRRSQFEKGDNTAKSNKDIIDVVLKDGSIVPVETVTTLVADKSGKVTHIVGVDREIDYHGDKARKQMEQDLKLNQVLLNDMGKIAKIAGWQLDVATSKVSWTDELEQIFDLDVNADNNVNELLSFYTANSRRIMIDALNEAINEGIPYDLELELISAKGTHKWIRSISKVIMHEGKVVELRGSLQDITERVRIENELRNAKEKAEESDRLKTVFLQNMSHEIRTPLNAIMGFAQLLPENFDNPEKLRNFSSIIAQRGADLLELINDLLELSKIETAQMSLNLVKFDLREIFDNITQVFQGLQKKFNKEHIQLVLPPEDEYLPNVLADKAKLGQILINLVNNALKFTESGTIEVGCKYSKKRVDFFVSDTGIGIPEYRLKDVFKRFVQLARLPGNLQSGTGLGLAIVKGLIEFMGGEITASSEVNKGSRFSFYILCEVNFENVIPKEEETPVAVPDISEQEILLVEDDYFSSEYIKEIFLGTAYRLHHVGTGREAIDFISQHPVEIFLVDIRLPDMEGYEVVRNIRKNIPEALIIAETAYAAQADYQNAINSGCDDYISKPINRHHLFSMLCEHMKKKN